LTKFFSILYLSEQNYTASCNNSVGECSTVLLVEYKRKAEGFITFRSEADQF